MPPVLSSLSSLSSRSAGAPRRRRPRRALTGRAIVLGAVVVLLLVVLASPLSRWFASRAAVRSAAQQLQQHEQQLARVQHQLQQWGDPGYVQRQARDRLQYAMPGEKVYIVVDHGQANEIQRTSQSRKSST